MLMYFSSEASKHTQPRFCLPPRRSTASIERHSQSEHKHRNMTEASSIPPSSFLHSPDCICSLPPDAVSHGDGRSPARDLLLPPRGKSLTLSSPSDVETKGHEVTDINVFPPLESDPWSHDFFKRLLV